MSNRLTALKQLKYLDVSGPIIHNDVTVLKQLTRLRALKIPGDFERSMLQPLFDSAPQLTIVADERKEHARQGTAKLNCDAFKSGMCAKMYWKPERTRLLKLRKF